MRNFITALRVSLMKGLAASTYEVRKLPRPNYKLVEYAERELPKAGWSYPNSSGPVVEIAVADCGIGIRSSLQKNPSHGMISSDIQAIEMSLREGVSSLRNPHRGYGLHHVTGDVKHNKNREMTVRSGQGILNIRGDGKVTKDYDSPTYSGTIVSVVIPCYST